MNTYKFDTREEIVSFLDNYDFKYYIPRVREYMSNLTDKLKYYYVELSDSNEVKSCYIVSISEGKEIKEKFFDIEKVDEFKNTAYNKEYREQKYQEGVENNYFNSSDEV